VRWRKTSGVVVGSCDRAREAMSSLCGGARGEGGESHMTREIHQHMYLACKTYRQILGKLPTKIAED
jgi:hypothetical protein